MTPPSNHLQPVSGTLVTVELDDAEREAVAGWLLSKRSANTRKAYARDLTMFVDWLTLTGHTLATATASTVETWATWQLEEHNAATASVARRCAAVSSFYQWAAKPDRLLQGRPNPASAELIDRVKASSVHTPALTLDETRRLITAAQVPNRWAPPGRDLTLVMILVSTGLRVQELIDANIGDLHNNAGTIMLTITGKGRQTRTVAIDPSVHHHIDTNRPANEPLVLNNQWQRLNQWQITRILNRLTTTAEIETNVTPHVLRATYITIGDELGARLEDLQANVGHSDPRRTQAYIRRHRTAQQQATLAAQLITAITN